MLWRDFAPFVLPYVPGCPVPVLEHHARIVSIDWCRKTLCHLREMESIPGGGTTFLEMYPPNGTQIIKIKAVDVGGVDWPLTDSIRGAKMARGQHPGYFAYTEDNITLRVYPALIGTQAVTVTAALAPTITANKLDDVVASQYLQDIAHGVIASLMMAPGQSFSSPQDAMIHSARYEALKVSAAGKVMRGMANVKMGGAPGFL
jgi:hypothetical protein